MEQKDVEQRRHQHEEPDERLDRNWNELLQELRVAQTGVQILTGFLLTLPFTQRFGELDRTQEIVYLSTLSGSVLATGLLVAPVAMHRALFRQGLRPWLVARAHAMAQAGLVALACTIVSVVWFVFDLVLGGVVATVAAGVTLVFHGIAWGVLPLLRRRDSAQADPSQAQSDPSQAQSDPSQPQSDPSGADRPDPGTRSQE